MVNSSIRFQEYPRISAQSTEFGATPLGVSGLGSHDHYLDRCEDNFRFMSINLYDVTDGQLRLDTIHR